MFRRCLIFALLSLIFFEGASLAQSTDSLVLKERLLQQENNRYIQMAQRDNVISESQADSLRKVTTGTVEKPVQMGIDILFQIRDYIDHGYEEQMKIVNEPVMEEHYYSAHTMLPTKLSIPEDTVFPEEREAELQKLAMEQMAESIARDFEREKLPAWQIWWRKHIGFFFGNMAWFKGTVTYINGQEVLVPKDYSRPR
jgi:flagellar motor protein MotB